MLAETPRGRRLAPLLRFAALVTLCVCARGSSKRSSHARSSRPCPDGCSCGPNGHDKLAWRVDCTKLGLGEVPSPLDPFTTLLDLSMNNFTSLPPAAFSHLQALRELRLAGNDLVDLSTNCFSGLKNLRVLTLQNNQFHHVPGHALQNLPNLQSLRFDANHIEAVPAGSFSALHRLRHLWFDDNALQAVPIEALGELPSLQALTLALNHIRIIPSMAFKKLSNLIVLRLHNNHIERLESRCFEGLNSLDYLDLNDNRLTEFPTEIVSLPRLQELAFHSNNIAYIPEHAFKGNPLLHTIHFYDNPIKYVGHSTFQNLHKLQTLLMHGPSEMETFPDLNSTSNLRSLTLTGTRIASLPSRFCTNLQNLTFLDFSDNQLREMPTLNFCRHLAEVNLRRNEIAEVGEFTLHHLNLLKSLDLSENRINVIHPRAFVTLSKLNKLDLSRNSLLHLPTAGLAGLTQLKLGGNPMLFDLPPPSTFHDLRSLEVTFPYHCCAFGPSVWVSRGEHQSHSKEGNHASFPVDIEDLEPHDYIQDLDSNLQPEIHCSPSPGPLQPCDNLLGGWLVRLGVWFLSGTGIIANALVVILTFSGSRSPPLARRLLGLLAGTNLATGFHGGALSVMDGAWFGHFAQIGPRWESSLGCRLAAFLAVWAAESALLVMAVVVTERASYCLTCRNKSRPSRCRFVGPAAVLAITGAGLLAAPQLAGGLVAGPLCLPLPGLPGSSPYYTATLVLLNAVVFLGMVVACAGLHCTLNKAQQAVEAAEQAMVRHITWLVFVNGLLFFPAAFFGISALLHPVVVPPTVSRSILLLFLPLPACLNPLLYLLFSPRARLEVTALHAVLCCRGWHRPPTIATTVSVTPSTQAWTRPLLSARKPAIATGASHICLVPCRFANDGIDSSSQSGTTDEEELGTSSRPLHGFLFLDHS